MSKHIPLVSDDRLTQLALDIGIKSWSECLSYIQQLPYGRNSSRSDFGLVLKEGKGSCSSKHALLKRISDLNKVPGVELILGIYKMNVSNTPGIGSVLEKSNLEYLPEAHCYLRINGDRLDVTKDYSDIGQLEKDIILEKEITPDQVIEFKVEFHKNFLIDWIRKYEVPYDLNALWTIREKCITNLSN